MSAAPAPEAALSTLDSVPETVRACALSAAASLEYGAAYNRWHRLVGRIALVATLKLQRTAADEVREIELVLDLEEIAEHRKRIRFAYEGALRVGDA